MVLNNTQANIFKVNGGLADNFANRPAANGSFYLFYSIDTQEIYYDNGAWILIGASGGGGVNIYNSDGILTGNRQLDGNNNILSFVNVNSFEVYNSFFTINANNSFIDLINNDIRLNVDGANNILKTTYQGNDIGLKLDFLNQSYSLGDSGSFAGSSVLIVDDANQRISTRFLSGIEGIDIQYQIGFAQFGFINTVNSTQLYIDDLNSLIKTSYQGNDIGLKLDFANNTYSLGDNINFNQINFIVNNGNTATSQYITTQEYASNKGLYIDFFNQIYCLGVADGGDFINTITGFKLDVNNAKILLGDTWSNNFLTYLEIDYSSNQVIKTSNQGNDIGLKLDFANDQYFFGNTNTNAIILDNVLPLFSVINGINQGLAFGNGVYQIKSNAIFQNDLIFEVNDTNEIIKTSYQGNDIGLKLDFANKIYQFGQITGGNNTSLNIQDNVQQIFATKGISPNGLLIDFVNNTYRLGDYTGSNGYIQYASNVLSFANTNSVEFNGTGLTSGTSGGNSGQHLIIKINSNTYKIALLNP